MQSRQSTHLQWTFVADAPRYYDLTKRDEENDHLGHAWFDKPESQSTFPPTLQHTEEPTTVKDTHSAISIGYQDDDGYTLDYDDQPVNYTTDVYFNSPSHRRQITKRRDIKTELSRTRQEQTQHLQGDNTMEYTGLDDAPSERAADVVHQLSTPPRQPTSTMSPSNPQQNQNGGSIIRNYLSTNDEEQQQLQEEEDEDGYRMIKLPLLRRIIISPKATSSTESDPNDAGNNNNPAESVTRIRTAPRLPPDLGTASQTYWATEQQSSPPPPPPPTEKETSSLDDRHYNQPYSTHHSISSSSSKHQVNHNEETQQHQQGATTHSHEPEPPQLRKRLYSEELDDNQNQPALKKRQFSPQHHHIHSPAPENQPPSSSQLSPLLQLIAKVKAYKRPPPTPPQQQPLSPLLQLIARVKSFKRQYPSHHHSLSWKTESVVDRAKRVMKNARTIYLQSNLPEQQQQQRQHIHQRRLTTISTTSTLPSALKRHERRLVDPIPPEENRNDDELGSDPIELFDDEMIGNKRQQRHPSGSVIHSFISPYLPVALTVPRSPKFSSEKRSRRW